VVFVFFFFFFFLPSKNLSNFVVWTRSEEQLGISCDSSCKLCRFFDFVLTSLGFRSSNVFGKEIPIGFCVLRIFSSAACSSSFGEAQLSSAQHSTAVVATIDLVCTSQLVDTVVLDS
jgi:hypothetical protein